MTNFRKRLKSKKHDCHEKDHDFGMTQCINEVLARHMNCSLPWSTPWVRANIFDTCTGVEKLKELSELTQKMATSGTELEKELESNRCLIPNCETFMWERILSDPLPLVNIKGIMRLSFYFPANSPVCTCIQ